MDYTFTTRFADCHFDKTIFSPLGGEMTIPNECQELPWEEPTMSHLHIDDTMHLII